MNRLTVLIAAIALSASACTGNNSTTTPTSDPPSVTDTFDGALNPNGGRTFDFSVAKSGSLGATVTALTPDTAVLGVALGVWNGSGCQIWLANDNATLNTSLSGVSSAAGSLCVRVYDVGKITDPVTFQVQVLHY